MSSTQEKPRVLIVDDTPDNVRLLMAFLRNLCDVTGASDGTQALQVARSEPHPDLILLDVVMPGMTGYQVCEELKRDAGTSNIPVIFVTGLVDTGEEERGLKLGAVDYITKPFHPELVRARVQNHLELKRHRDYLEEEVDRRSKALLEARSIRQRMESELEVASRLQHSMLPAPLFADSRHRGCQVATLFQAARAVGGDLYDYFFLDDTSILFALGDVSDKGVAAALFMVRVITLLRTLGASAFDPAWLLTAINQSLCADNPSCMFVTMVLGILRLDTGQILLASGGQECPILVSGDGQATVVDLQGGPALGLVDDAEYQNQELILRADQSLVFYTDGVTEATNRQQECFGEERLLAALVGQSHENPEIMVDGLMKSLREFVNGAEPFDDMTILVLKNHLGERA